MATLVFSALGTALGGPIGGALGALIGRQADAAIIGNGRREGHRLKELSVSTSSYGSPIPLHFGRMRVPGSVIWATDLVEHNERQGGGKSKPSVTTYNYTTSFAVALSSRPIAGVGRIWADGNLLRGSAGDLKCGGSMRFYSGQHDQAPDPLMAAIEGPDRCPAYRGIAYIVFEDLELADFANRIPTLTFEVFADENGFSLQEIVDPVLDDADAAVDLTGLSGLSCEGPLIDTLRLLDPLFPMDCDAGGERVTFARERLQTSPIALPEPAISVHDDDFGGATGYARKRSSTSSTSPEILRYYDIDRDYQPGLQRALGRPGRGQPITVELPASMNAPDARKLAERIAQRADWSREKMAWRTAELNPAIGPGAILTVPNQPGHWRITEWEWRESGVELSLSRIVPTGPDTAIAVPVDPGRANPPVDLPAPPTLLTAFELPWDGEGADTPTVFAAVSSPAANWKGAALFVDHGDGNLVPLGPSGRSRSIIGSSETTLAPASPLLLDRSSTLTIQLLDDRMTLSNADARRLAFGANRALVGNEIVQFAKATPLGGGRWELEHLLRGRAGTEMAISNHVGGEPFVLLDAAPISLDPAIIGGADHVTILAAGLGDQEAVSSEIGLRGITRRPLSPVHSRTRFLPDGGLVLTWTRRARGAWTWQDGVDVPLNEQAERYQVIFGPVSAPITRWAVTVPSLTIDANTLAHLAALDSEGRLHVQQHGDHALSEALRLTSLPLSHMITNGR